MDILTNIVRDKRLEVNLKKSVVSYKELEATQLFERETIGGRRSRPQ